MKLGYSFPVRRRGFLATIGSLAAFSVVSGSALRASAEPRKGRLKQGVCLGVFSGTKLDMEGKCREAARLGAYGIDLVGPNEFPLLKQYGLVPTMVPGGTGIQSGINDKKNHTEMARKM
jgi:hydroxypyruvate isomerase